MCNRCGHPSSDHILGEYACCWDVDDLVCLCQGYESRDGE